MTKEAITVVIVVIEVFKIIIEVIGVV